MFFVPVSMGVFFYAHFKLALWLGQLKDENRSVWVGLGSKEPWRRTWITFDLRVIRFLESHGSDNSIVLPKGGKLLSVLLRMRLILFACTAFVALLAALVKNW